METQLPTLDDRLPTRGEVVWERRHAASVIMPLSTV